MDLDTQALQPHPVTGPRRVVRASIAAVIGALAMVLVLAACGSEGASSDGPTEGDEARGQGGVSADEVVTLRLDVASTDQDQMRDVTQVVQRRLDALGIERSDIGWDGSTIEVLVPDGDEALLRAALQGPAVIEFRPVLAVVGEVPTGEDLAVAQARAAELRARLGVPDGISSAQIVADEQAKEEAARAGGSDEDRSGGEDSTAALNRWGVDVYVPEFAELFELEGRLGATPTPPEERDADAEVTLVGEDGATYVLGPAAVDNRAVVSATAEKSMSDQWAVYPVFTEGPDGIEPFNELAAQCYEGQRTCPSLMGDHGQVAIVVDGLVISAPSINTPEFEADQISISGSFDEISATALAAALQAGASPVGWTLQD